LLEKIPFKLRVLSALGSSVYPLWRKGGSPIYFGSVYWRDEIILAENPNFAYIRAGINDWQPRQHFIHA